MAQQQQIRTGYTSSPGNAPVVRMGHTTDGTQGSDPNASEIPDSPARDLRPN